MEQLVIDVSSNEDAHLIKELLKRFKNVEVNSFNSNISEKEIKPVEFKYSLSENFEMALNDELKDFNPDLVLIGAPSKDNWKEIYNEIPKKLLSSQKTDLFVYI